jgi:hypothetical protein
MTFVGMIYLTITQNQVLGYLYVWVFLLLLLLVGYLGFSITIQIELTDNKWSMVHKAIYIPIRKYKGKISNLSTIISSDAMISLGKLTQFFSGQKQKYIAQLQFELFYLINSSQSQEHRRFQIVRLQTINFRTHQKHISEITKICAAIMAQFQKNGIPIDYSHEKSEYSSRLQNSDQNMGEFPSIDKNKLEFAEDLQPNADDQENIEDLDDNYASELNKRQKNLEDDDK